MPGVNPDGGCADLEDLAEPDGLAAFHRPPRPGSSRPGVLPGRRGVVLGNELNCRVEQGWLPGPPCGDDDVLSMETKFEIAGSLLEKKQP